MDHPNLIDLIFTAETRRRREKLFLKKYTLRLRVSAVITVFLTTPCPHTLRPSHRAHRTSCAVRAARAHGARVVMRGPDFPITTRPLRPLPRDSRVRSARRFRRPAPCSEYRP